MNSTYRLKVDELDASFLDGLKILFRGKEIEIEVSEVDETSYLLHSSANRDHLLHSVREVNTGTNVVKPDPTLFS